MIVGNGFHLTYCSNIHRAHTWDEVDASLRASLPVVRAHLGVAGPLAIGLRLSAEAANTLAEQQTFARFRGFLTDGGYYVPTINGFPYGAFHGGRVKEQVYQPDWRAEARLAYTNQLADLLAALPGGGTAVSSVSTVPGAFRSEVRTADDARAIAVNILRHAAHLATLRDRTGVTIALAIEPEPSCFIETVSELAAFFERDLLDAAAIGAAGAASGVTLTPDHVRRHIGACLDTCHMAVEFEDPHDAVGALRRVGMRVFKVQVSSALDLRERHPAGLRSILRPYADDVYLHQVVSRTDGALARFTDVPDALASLDATPADQPCDWRVHFHVPLFVAEMNGVATTQWYVATVLDLLRRDPFCEMLEVETYTWDVLPAEYRNVDQCTAIARELAWTRAQIER